MVGLLSFRKIFFATFVVSREVNLKGSSIVTIFKKESWLNLYIEAGCFYLSVVMSVLVK